MEQKDTTGAGKTLDKLMGWWEARFRSEEETTTNGYAEAVIRQFNQESILLTRLLRNREIIRYEYLRGKLEGVIDIQKRIVDQLRRLAAEQDTPVSEGTMLEPADTFGLTLSKDLHEANAMYHEYARLAAKSTFSSLQDRFEELAHEKEHQIKILTEIVPKIHN